MNGPVPMLQLAMSKWKAIHLIYITLNPKQFKTNANKVFV